VKALGAWERLLPYVRPHVRMLALGGLLALVVAAMDGAIAWLVKPAMDDIFIRRDLFMLKVLPLALLAAYMVKGVARYLQAYLMSAVGQRIIARLRRELYGHIQGMPLAFFTGRHSADRM
jgi:subfamily B ATP-binding cassette protein MsbA